MKGIFIVVLFYFLFHFANLRLLARGLDGV